MLLCNAEVGKNYRVTEIKCKKEITERLSSLGIVKGARILIVRINKLFKGAVVFADSVNIAIGRAVATGIEVELWK